MSSSTQKTGKEGDYTEGGGLKNYHNPSNCTHTHTHTHTHTPPPPPPPPSVYEKQVIVEVRGLDIFGCSPQSLKKNIDCICPNCSRSLGALKFAPHLEKCMGMGRLSSRLAATKKYSL